MTWSACLLRACTKLLTTQKGPSSFLSVSVVSDLLNHGPLMKRSINRTGSVLCGSVVKGLRGNVVAESFFGSLLNPLGPQALW